MPDDRIVNTSMEVDGNETYMIIMFDPESENPIEIQKEGWQAILNNFKKYAEAN